MTEIMNAWEYDGGELGFRRGREVHVTDWGQGKVKALTDWVPKLPWADPDCIWLYEQSSACGVIKDSEVWFSDHPDIYKIHDRYPSLPADWNDGITNVWEYKGGELGFRRGREVHVTDWGQGKVKALTEWAPKLPWADPDCIWLYEQSSACGVIKDSEVWFSDHPDIYKIHDRYPSLPSGW